MKSYPATFILLAILFCYFAIELTSGALGSDEALLRLGAIPDSGGLQGEYWRLLTYSLLHSGYLHLLMNSLLLWWTGRIVERRVGGIFIISIFAASVVSGGLLTTLWKSFHPTPTVSLGASAGTFGLLAASLVLLYRPAARRFGESSRVRSSSWLILGVGMAVSFLPSISLVGHLGGLASGIVLGAAVPVLAGKEIHNGDNRINQSPRNPSS